MSATESIKSKAAKKGFKCVDCGNGHIQIRVGKQTVNYWPNSKQRTVHVSESNERHTGFSVDDVLLLCEEIAVEIRPMKTSFVTNPSNITEFYKGVTPPWVDIEAIQKGAQRIAAKHGLQS